MLDTVAARAHAFFIVLSPRFLHLLFTVLPKSLLCLPKLL